MSTKLNTQRECASRLATIGYDWLGNVKRVVSTIICDCVFSFILESKK